MECGEERSGEVRGELGTPFFKYYCVFGVREVVVDGGQLAVVRLLIPIAVVGACRGSWGSCRDYLGCCRVKVWGRLGILLVWCIKGC